MDESAATKSNRLIAFSFIKAVEKRLVSGIVVKRSKNRDLFPLTNLKASLIDDG
jgi:hypothetical protein